MKNGQPTTAFDKQDQEFMSCFVRELPIQDVLSQSFQAMLSILPEMSDNEKQNLIENSQTELRSILRKLFLSMPIDNSQHQDIIFNLQKFYQEWFNITINTADAVIPSNAGTGLEFLQFMPKGLTYQQMHDVEKVKYPAYWDWNNDWLSKIDMDFEERKTDKNYFIWHSGSAEADETYNNKSANWILKKKIKTMTRLEGGIFGLYMLWKYNIIIDQKVVSLWSGSRYSGGSVPGSHWGSGSREFRSDWYDPDGTDGKLRPRVAVSE